jgi:hypothetical protein
MHAKDAIEQLVTQILDNTELRLKVDAYTLEENLESGITKIRCDVHDERSGAREVITGQGVGAIDAMFHGLVQLYSGKYPSLKSIRFTDFSIKANIDTGRESARSDMAAEVSLRVANSDDKEYIFAHASPSITRSSLAVVLKCVEFFINSERAFIEVYRALQHAKRERRPDSIARYTSQLTTLVEATSYTETIDGIRKSELGG